MTQESHDETKVNGSNPTENTTKVGTSLIGRKLGDYQVLRKLGRGGMADVYVARQLSLGRDVALKVLKQELARDDDYVSRFRREARAAAKLNHPNIVQVYDVGSTDAMHYIAQELIDGENLKEVVSGSGSLTTEEAIEVLVGVASALDIASEAGITHRDIKPENIMRSRRGIIKVADFGLARLGADAGASRADLTQAGLTLGTPRYMSPEQVQGKTTDVRSDLYSLGVSMYHMLSGRPPFEADDPIALAVMHLHETPIPLDRARSVGDQGQPDLPEWLIAIVGRLMSKLPSDRFQSAAELLDAIRNQASDSIGGFGTVGTAAATIRLQRLTDVARTQRQRRTLRIGTLIGMPLLCTMVGSAIFSAQPTENVRDHLLPEVVAEQETVQEQFLNAAIRNDEPGWRAVIEYFPPNNATNTAYRSKAMLQLASLLATQKRFREADDLLAKIINDPNIDRLYVVIALARQSQVLAKGNTPNRLAKVRKQLLAAYTSLRSNNPEAANVFDDVVPEQERMELGIVDSST